MDFKPVDADNHYYEPLDAFTRHLDKEFARRGVRPVAGRQARRAPDRRPREPLHPEPDLRPDHRARLPRRAVPRPDPEGRRPAHADEGRAAARASTATATSASPSIEEQGLERCCSSRRSAAASRRRCATTSTPRWRACTPSTAGSRRTGASSTSDRLIAAPMLSLADPDAAVRGGRLAARARRAHRARPPRARAGPERHLAARSATSCTIRCGRGSRRRRSPSRSTSATAATTLLSRGVGRPARTFEGFGTTDVLGRIVVSDRAIHDTIASLVIDGVFKRHPALRVASIENGSDWLHLLVKRLRKQANQTPWVFPEDPLDTIRKHVWVDAVLRGGSARAGRADRRRSASCSAPTGRTAKGSRSRSTSRRSSRASTRRRSAASCATTASSCSGRGTRWPTRSVREAGAELAREVVAWLEAALGSGALRRGVVADRRPRGLERAASREGGGRPRPAALRRAHGARALRVARRAASAGRSRPADGRAHDPHGTGRPTRSRGTCRRSSRGGSAWCQLFSEPGAGSDLAGLATRAVRDGDRWIITGQKVWSSMAHESDYGMLLARTDPDAPKHGGISWFAFKLDQPGVTDPPAARDDRRGDVQRGVPRRCGVRPRRSDRRREQRLDRHADDALLRAHGDRGRRQPRRLPEPGPEGRHARSPSGRRGAGRAAGERQGDRLRRAGRARDADGAQRRPADPPEARAAVVVPADRHLERAAQPRRSEVGGRRDGREHRQARPDPDHEALGRDRARRARARPGCWPARAASRAAGS